MCVGRRSTLRRGPGDAGGRGATKAGEPDRAVPIRTPLAGKTVRSVGYVAAGTRTERCVSDIVHHGAVPIDLLRSRDRGPINYRLRQYLLVLPIIELTKACQQLPQHILALISVNLQNIPKRASSVMRATRSHRYKSITLY
jgi:hypothetical protein